MSKADKTDAWMPLYIGDWDGDTGHLSCEEDGAYGRLVRHYWRMGPLPDNDAALARIVRMDLKAWKRIRPVLAGFFQIGDDLWRHGRVDAELKRWAEKKAAATAKAQAAAEKRWSKGDDPKPPHAKSKARRTPLGNAPSMPQTLPGQCPSSSPFQVEAPKGASTLKAGEPPADRPDGSASARWPGPGEVWDAFAEERGAEWCASYLAPCGWQDVPDRALVPATDTAGAKIIREGRTVLHRLGVSVLGRAA